MSKEGKNSVHIFLTVSKEMHQALEEERVRLRLDKIPPVIRKILGDHFKVKGETE